MEIISIIILFIIPVLIITLLYDKYKLYNIKYECFFNSDEYYEGDEAEFTEVIINNKFFPVPWIKSELTVSKYLEFSGLHSVVTDRTRFVASFFSLKSYCKIQRTWKVKCLKRGCYSVEDIVVLASDILGFSKSSMFIDKAMLSNAKITVLPLRGSHDDSSNNKSLISGDIFTKPKLICDPFFINGIREYSITDSIKSINWYATAKSQQLMVNKNDYTTNRSVTLMMNMQSMPSDINEVIYKEYIEKCIRICAGIIYDYCNNGMIVRFMSNTSINDIPVDITSSDYLMLFRQLAALEFNISDSFNNYLSYTIPEITESEIIIVSSFETEYFDILKNENKLISFIKADITGGNI